MRDGRQSLRGQMGGPGGLQNHTDSIREAEASSGFQIGGERGDNGSCGFGNERKSECFHMESSAQPVCAV